jgi:hypothetical protein
VSNIRFVVFHTGVDTLPLYKPLMEVGQRALAATNPGARYVVLTDKKTARHLDKEFEVEAIAPPDKPLMWQYVEAQRVYESRAEPGLVVLAASDCAANRDLNDALRHNVAITYRNLPEDKCLINNVAYVEDHDRMAWFLKRALAVMRPDQYNFWGDQQSWQDALGPISGWQAVDDREYGVRRAEPEGRWIHLYPCRTHNCFPKRNGQYSGSSHRAYLIHYKGNRKLNMVESVRHYILGPGGQAPNWNDLMASKSQDLPMEGKRSEDSGAGAHRVLGTEASQDTS